VVRDAVEDAAMALLGTTEVLTDKALACTPSGSWPLSLDVVRLECGEVGGAADQLRGGWGADRIQVVGVLAGGAGLQLWGEGRQASLPSPGSSPGSILLELGRLQLVMACGRCQGGGPIRLRAAR